MTAISSLVGFSDPSRDSQAVFRTVMRVMARPGTIGHLTGVTGAPAPLSSGCTAVALTLCDHETPIWLDAALARAAGVADFLRFHTGAPIVSDPGAAAFALVADPANLPPFDTFALGSIDYPDRSTTLILAVERLDADGWRLSGPGIDGTVNLVAASLPADFAERRGALAPLFPRGLDILFVAGERVAALPRTTRLEP